MSSLFHPARRWMQHIIHGSLPYCQCGNQSRCHSEHVSTGGSDRGRGWWLVGVGGHSGFWLDESSTAAPSSFIPKHLVSTMSKWMYVGRGLLIGWVDSSGREKVSYISISHWQELCCEDNCGFVAVRVETERWEEGEERQGKEERASEY